MDYVIILIRNLKSEYWEFKETILIEFHDQDRNGLLSPGDSLVIKSRTNGGIAQTNDVVTLVYIPTRSPAMT